MIIIKKSVSETDETAAVFSLSFLTDGDHLSHYYIDERKKKSMFKGAKHVFLIGLYNSLKKLLKEYLDRLEKEITFISSLFRLDHFNQGF